MKTEEVTREPRGAGQTLSRALQDLAPLSCELIDHRGRRVQLSVAGYVLRAGKRYRLRLRLPNDPDVLGVQVVNPPDFLRVGREVATADSHGQPVRDIPLKAGLDLGATVYRLGDVRCDEIDVSLQFRRESGKQGWTYSCPVIVRPGWTPIVLGAIGTVLSLLGPVVGKELFSGGASTERDIGRALQLWLTNPVLWVCLAAITVTLLGVYGYTLHQLRARAQELRETFADLYPDAARGQ